VTFWGWLRVIQQHQALACIDPLPDFLQNGEEIRVDEDQVVLGVVDGVQDLLRRQTYVDGMQDRPHHGHRKKALEIAVAVPIHDTDRVTWLHP
jgi:hypothetical protein